MSSSLHGYYQRRLLICRPGAWRARQVMCGTATEPLSDSVLRAITWDGRLIKPSYGLRPSKASARKSNVK